MEGVRSGRRRPCIVKEVIDRAHVAEAVAKWDALGNSDRAKLKRWRFVAEELGIAPHGRKAEIEEAIGAAPVAAAAAAPAAAAAASAAAAAAGGGGGSHARGSRGGSLLGMEVTVVCPSCKNPTSSVGGRVMLCDDCSRRTGSPSKSPSPRRCVPSALPPPLPAAPTPILPPYSAPNPLAPDRRAPSASRRAVGRRAEEAVRPSGGIAALLDEGGGLHVAVQGVEAVGAAARAVMGLAILLGSAPPAAVIAFASSAGAGAAAPPPPSAGLGASTALPPPATLAASASAGLGASTAPLPPTSPAAPCDAALASLPSPAPASAQGALTQVGASEQGAPLVALSAPASAAFAAAQSAPAPPAPPGYMQPTKSSIAKII